MAALMYTFYFKVKLRSFLIKYGSLNALLYPDALTPLSARTLRVRETKFRKLHQVCGVSVVG